MLPKFFKWLFAVFIAFIFGGLFAFVESRDFYKKQIEHLQSNEKTLLTDVERFKVGDSLNAVKVGVLSLELSQYKQYHADDLRLINELGVKNKELQMVNETQLQTIRRISGVVRDSFIYVDRIIVDSMKCARIRDKWLNMDMCFRSDGTYYGQIETRDSLLIVSSVKYKRFLGFLWKTKKVKSRDVRVVSKNPYTKIVGFQFVELKE